MSEIYDRQKAQEDLQRNDLVLDAFSKIVSGRQGYKAIIEKKQVVIKCRKCNLILDISQKFCPQCGTKVWVKPTKCPKCSKGLFAEDKFCTDCGENLEPPPL